MYCNQEGKAKHGLISCEPYAVVVVKAKMVKCLACMLTLHIEWDMKRMCH